MFTVVIFLVLVAFVLAILSTAGRVPLTYAVFVLCVIELIQLWPR